MKKHLNIIPFLLAFYLISLNVCYAQYKLAIEAVKILDKGYGGPQAVCLFFDNQWRV